MQLQLSIEYCATMVIYKDYYFLYRVSQIKTKYQFIRVFLVRV
jgi:hypothetical protein